MATAGSVRYKIEADSSDLVKEGKKVERRLDQQEQDLKDNQRAWKKTGDVAEKSMKEAKKGTDRLSSAVGGLKKAFAALAIAAVAKQLGDLVNAMATGAKEMENFSNLSGLSLQTLQQMEYIGRRLGTDFRDIADAQLDITESINQTIALQDKQRIEAYGRLGIGQQELRELTSLTGLAQIERLSQLVNRSGRTRDEQITILRDAGLNEQRVLQLATEGEALIESTETQRRASDESIKAFANLKDSITDFAGTAWSVLLDTTAELAPKMGLFLDELKDLVVELSRSGGVNDLIKILGVAIEHLIEIIPTEKNLAQLAEEAGIQFEGDSYSTTGLLRSPGTAAILSEIDADARRYLSRREARRAMEGAGTGTGEGTEAAPVVVRLQRSDRYEGLGAIAPQFSARAGHVPWQLPPTMNLPASGDPLAWSGLRAVEAGITDEQRARERLGAQIVMEQELRGEEMSALDKTTQGLSAATQALGILDQVTGGSSERLRKFTAFLATLQAGLSVFQTIRSIFFADGGFTPSGKPFIAGEFGPELITANRSMYVHNPMETQAMLRGMRGETGGGTTINISSLDPEGTLRLMNRYYPQFKSRLVDDFTRPGTENTLLQGRGF